MEQPKDLTNRQWWLYRLVKWSSEQGKKLSIKDIVDYQEQYKDKLTFTDYYSFKDADGNHSNCPDIYKDKDAINETEELDKILCVKNNQFYIGTEEETIHYHNKLMHNVCHYSHKAKIIRDKISQDGQGKLFTYDLVEIEKSNGRSYHEAFLRQETILKENEKLKELLKAYKNAADMWKERYEYLKGQQQ